MHVQVVRQRRRQAAPVVQNVQYSAPRRPVEAGGVGRRGRGGRGRRRAAEAARRRRAEADEVANAAGRQDRVGQDAAQRAVPVR